MDKATSLTEIATMNSQDQVGLGYMPLYESIFEPFRFEPMRILEIGFSSGRGARTLGQFFPRATIHTCDFEAETVCKVYYDNLPEELKPRVHLHQCDQGKPEDLVAMLRVIEDRKGAKFRIILDDGSHFPEHQVSTFQALWPYVKEGGYYIIEDMHPGYRKGQHAAITYFTNLVHQMNKEGNIKNKDGVTSDIDWVMFPFNRIVLRRQVQR